MGPQLCNLNDIQRLCDDRFKYHYIGIFDFGVSSKLSSLQVQKHTNKIAVVQGLQPR